MATDSTTWKRVPIVDLCVEHVDCVNRTAPVVDGPTPFKMIRTTNVRNGFIDIENVKYVTEETYKRWTRRLVPKRGDVILTREAPLGDVGKLRTDDLIFLGQRLYHFRPDPKKLEADFLLYALMAPDLQGQIKALGSGSTVEHMRLGDIPSLKIEVPSLLAQCRIAGILSAYDELIENNRRRIKILEEMARSLYREWFVYFLFPGHKSVQWADSALGKIPLGWSVGAIKDLADFISRGPSLSYVDNGGIPVVNQRCVRNSVIQLEAIQYAQPLTEGKSHLYLQRYDTLINSMGVGTLGRVSRNVSISEAIIIHNCITVVRSSKAKEVAAYLFYCLSGKEAHFESLAIGATGQTSLRIEDVSNLQILIPPQSLLRQFSRTVLPLWDQVGILMRQQSVLRHTRDLLLPRLLSGAVVPS